MWIAQRLPERMHMDQPQLWDTQGNLIPLELWEHLSTDDAGTAVFRYCGETPFSPARIVAPSGEDMPILPGVSFAKGMTLGLPSIPPAVAGQSRPFKVRAMGDVIRNGQVVRD
jgi:hypothetical protein